jgi:hypothetical protein
VAAASYNCPNTSRRRAANAAGSSIGAAALEVKTGPIAFGHAGRHGGRHRISRIFIT